MRRSCSRRSAISASNCRSSSTRAPSWCCPSTVNKATGLAAALKSAEDQGGAASSGSAMRRTTTPSSRPAAAASPSPTPSPRSRPRSTSFSARRAARAWSSSTDRMIATDLADILSSRVEPSARAGVRRGAQLLVSGAGRGAQAQGAEPAALPSDRRRRRRRDMAAPPQGGRFRALVPRDHRRRGAGGPGPRRGRGRRARRRRDPASDPRGRRRAWRAEASGGLGVIDEVARQAVVPFDQHRQVHGLEPALADDDPAIDDRQRGPCRRAEQQRRHLVVMRP